MATEATGLSSRPLALHAGGLHPSTSEIELYHFFSEIQVTVNSLRIIRDEKDKAARYAYINFLSPEDAEKALNSLNYKLFKGQEILLSRSIPASQRNAEANLHVSQLPVGCTSEQLYNAFSPYGNIVSARVNVDPSGNRRSYGYVQYDLAETAAKAIAATTDVEIAICGAKNIVKAVVFKPAAERPRQLTNVFIRNFPVAKGAAAFEDMAKQYGNVTSIFFNDKITQLNGTEQSATGFGFANYATPEEAAAALKAIPALVVDGFQLEAFEPKSKSDRQREVQQKSSQFSLTNANLYVKHLSTTQPAEELEAFFKTFGDVLSFRLQTTESGARTGVAFVQYRLQEQAQAAIPQCFERKYWAGIHQNKVDRQRSLANGDARAQHYNGRRQRGYNYQPRAPQMYPHNQYNMYPQQPRMYQRMPAYPPQPYNGNYPQQPPQQRRPRQQNGQQRAPQRRHNRRQPNNAANPEEQSLEQVRQKLGEKLFWLVQKIDSEQAPKITGMLLEMKQEEVQEILNNEGLLQAKVKEAQAILAATTTTTAQ